MVWREGVGIEKVGDIFVSVLLDVDDLSPI